MYQKDKVLELLVKACQKCGSQKLFAQQHGLSPQYVGDVLKLRREPGDAILDALGLRKVTYYVPRSPTLRAPVRAEQNGASELVCTFDNDGGGIDVDVLKKMLKGKHGFLVAKPYANGQVQFSMTPHSTRSAGG